MWWKININRFYLSKNIGNVHILLSLTYNLFIYLFFDWWSTLVGHLSIFPNICIATMLLAWNFVSSFSAWSISGSLCNVTSYLLKGVGKWERMALLFLRVIWWYVMCCFWGPKRPAKTFSRTLAVKIFIFLKAGTWFLNDLSHVILLSDIYCAGCRLPLKQSGDAIIDSGV